MHKLRKIQSSDMKACGFSLGKTSWQYRRYKLMGCDDWYLVFRPNGQRWRTMDNLKIAMAVIDEEEAG